MNRIEAVQSNFCCPKCKGRTANVERVRLPFVGARFPIKPAKFLVVTCTLCGYTEFYDLAVYAEERETAEENSKSPARPATGESGP